MLETIDINHVLRDIGQEIWNSGFVVNDHGQIVIYTGHRVNKDTGEIEYGDFGAGPDPEAYIPVLKDGTVVRAV